MFVEKYVIICFMLYYKHSHVDFSVVILCVCRKKERGGERVEGGSTCI